MRDARRTAQGCRARSSPGWSRAEVPYAEHLAADRGAHEQTVRDDAGGRRRRSTPRAVLILLGVVVSLAFMAVAARDAQLSETIDALRATDVSLLVPALGLLCVSFLLRAVRWQSLFVLRARPGFRPVLGAQFVGYLLNAVLPVRAGEAAAIVSLNRRARTPLSEATATMILQRAEDIVILVVLLFVMSPWLPAVGWVRAAGVAALVIVAVLAIVAILVARHGDRVVEVLLRPVRRLPFVPPGAFADAPANFTRGLAALGDPRVGLVSAGWTALAWSVQGLAFWIVLKACGIDLSPLAGMLVVIGIALAMVLPSSPAALGVFEGATVVVLGAYGVGGSQALSYALVAHALTVLPLFVVAAVLVVAKRIGRRRRVEVRSAES